MAEIIWKTWQEIENEKNAPNENEKNAPKSPTQQERLEAAEQAIINLMMEG